MTEDRRIIITYSPFDTESRAYVCKDGAQTSYRLDSDIAKMGEQVVELAYANMVYNIDVQGPLAMIHELIRKVDESEMRQFNESVITIRGI